jgi:hypothetical protein
MGESSKSGLIVIANEFAAQIFIPHDQDPKIASLRAKADPIMQEDKTQIKRFSSLPQIQGKCRSAIVNYAGRLLTLFEDPVIGEMQ